MKMDFYRNIINFFATFFKNSKNGERTIFFGDNEILQSEKEFLSTAKIQMILLLASYFLKSQFSYLVNRAASV